MRQTVVGVFDRYAAAQEAARTLEDRGFDHDHVHVTGTDEPSTSQASATERADREDEGVMASIRNFFSDLFGPDDSHEVGTYAEAVRRGGAVVKVEVEEEDEVDRAREALQQAGAVNIDERVEEWRATGWSPASDGLGGSPASSRTTAFTDADTRTDRDVDLRTDTAYRADADTISDNDRLADTDRFAETRERDSASEGVIPVVREELQVGKRAMNTGGVRVYSRVVEKPVEESVDLRTERAEVRRDRVDRPASESDLTDLRDKTIEVREMSEKPVVHKEARVVEEVSVDKRVENRTETVRDTLRNTEVEVEQLGGSERMGSDRMGDRASRRVSAFEDLDTEYRRDFDTNYAATGARYEDYQPAYRYGHTLAADERYAGRDWDDIETDVRSDWERRNPGSAWERFKASVRHAWERATH